MYGGVFPTFAFDKEFEVNSYDILGNSVGGVTIPTIAVKATVSADSGTVKSSSFNGVLAIEYQKEQVAVGKSTLGLDFNGLLSNFTSNFGMKAEIEATITLIDGTSVSLSEDLGPLLAPNQNYDAALAPQEIKKSNTAVGVGPAYEGTLEVLGTEVGYKATFGAELVVKQTTTLLERLIFGKITATHQSAGSRVASFSINSDGTTNVDIDLDIAGIWELSISDISFSTAMKHLFTVAPTLTAGLELINPDYESECTGYTKGLCEKGRELLSKKIKESNEKLSFKKDDFVDFSTDEITAAKLHYISSNSFDSFLINVGDMPTPPVPPIDPNNPTAVPEPSTLAIFALGIMGLASRRFRKQ